MRERRPSEQTPDQRPHFIRTIDRTGMVGIMPDDTWKVGWNQPDGRIVWHTHQDILGVFRQNERVIQRFLDKPIIDESQQEEARTDPSLGVSLPDLMNIVMIRGEIRFAQDLSSRINRLRSLLFDHRIPVTVIIVELNGIRREIGPHVKNPLKVGALTHLAFAQTAQTVEEVQQYSAEAYEALLLRAYEGTSIVTSLLRRGGEIIKWVDQQELLIRNLKNAVGAALVEILRAKERSEPVRRQSIELWKDRFGGITDILRPSFEIRGHPYAGLLQRRELLPLKEVRSVIDSGDVARVERIFSAAYPVLDNAVKDWEDREKSGRYGRYRATPQSGPRR